MKTTQNIDAVPPCSLYADLLDKAVEKLGITRDEARNKYGQYTTKQWYNLLNK